MAPSTCFVCFNAISQESPGEDSVTCENLNSEDPLKTLIEIFGWSFSTFTRNLIANFDYESVKTKCGFCHTCDTLVGIGSQYLQGLRDVRENLQEKAVSTFQDRRLKLAQVRENLSNADSEVETEATALQLGLRFTECKK